MFISAQWDELDVDFLDDVELSNHFENAVVDDGAERLFRILMTFPQPESGPPDYSTLLAFINTYFSQRLWKHCFYACLGRQDKERFRDLLAQKANTLVTHSVRTLIISGRTTPLTSY